MDIDLIQLLIICPLVFWAGFVDAVAGGGGLISLPAYMIAGLPVHFAIGTNKLSSGIGSLMATIRFARNGYIHWKRAGLCVIFALIGSAVGANIALLIDDYCFKIIMLFIIPLTAIYISRVKSLGEGYKEPFPEKKTSILSMLIALGIGVYDGFYGPGTGTFLLLLLSGVAHMKLSSANGIAKVINVTTNLAALVVFMYNGKVMVLLGLVAACFSVLGNYMGSKFFDTKGAKAVRPIMFVVLLLFFVKIITEIF